MKMAHDDACALKKALEPELHCRIEEAQESQIALYSIAVSLKRIADALERGQQTIDPPKAPANDQVTENRRLDPW